MKAGMEHSRRAEAEKRLLTWKLKQSVVYLREQAVS